MLRVERSGSAARSLPLVGHWRRDPAGPLHFAVDGDLLDDEIRLPTTGTLLVWPRHAFGQVIGMHRISLDVMIGPSRLRLDGAVGPPPYWRGVALTGHVDQGRRSEQARVSIDPLQLLAVWLELNAGPPAAAAATEG